VTLSHPIAIASDTAEAEPEARAFAQTFGIPLADAGSLPALVLHFSNERTYLSSQFGKKRITLDIDFASGAQAHRRKFGGGKSQAIAKAVGLSSKFKPEILDCTAGQGRDAFVLASLGSRVTMLERSPVAHALLQNALERGLRCSTEDPELAAVLERMSLHLGSASELVGVSGRAYDVVYLDPMFPERKKSALVKKEMQIFHQVIGADDDADALLAVAKSAAIYRVVVKRPKAAPPLAGEAPTYELAGKSSRFDIYAIKALPAV